VPQLGVVNWDETDLEDVLNSPDGLVGKYLEEKSEAMYQVALGAAPVQKPANFSWGKRSDSYMPDSMGFLKSNIRPHVGYTTKGTLFAGVNAPYGPTLFLEKPARQLHRAYPFLSLALYSVNSA
jgi:hypothetical protein